ncbi:MAG: carboxypeptidase-like regulatory domain-containing protein, partial [Acidobacteria bacterium]|nr:carboxypeptidase-like regulatory domain-containing protein [Acidobacteriota bacterium]
MVYRHLVTALAIGLAAPALLLAQGGLGSITGSVVDATGSFIPGATVRLVQVTTQSARNVTSNEAGVFHLPSVVPGEYYLTIHAGGFKEKRLNNLVVNGFQQLAVG